MCEYGVLGPTTYLHTYIYNVLGNGEGKNGWLH